MNNLLPLMQREWLQHRFAWALLLWVPLGLALAVLGIGTIELDDEMSAMPPQELALVLTAMTVVISFGVMVLLSPPRPCSMRSARRGVTMATARWSSGCHCPAATPKA
jgi:hypothetical protein